MRSLVRRVFGRYRFAFGVAALAALTAPLGVSRRPLWVGDETREAAIAKHMADSGDFFQTRLAGIPRAEKPPFFYASVASSIRLCHGATRFSTRLPSILFSAMTLLSAAAAASILFSQRAGLFTAAILSTTYLFAVNAHNVVVDVSLTAFVTMGLLAFVASSRSSGFPRWNLGFGLAAAGAMLAKGFVGLALLFLLTLPFWLFSRSRRRLSESVSAGAWLAPVAALLLWTGVTFGRGGIPALSEAIWNQQIGRLLGFRRREYSHHRAPFYFYLAALPGMLFPWIVTLPAAVRGGLRQRARGRADASVFLPLATGLAAALLLLSFAGTKRTIYFLPVVPVAAILVGTFLDTQLSEGDSRVSWSLWLQFAVVALTAVAVPLLPATADGKITPAEAACVGAVVLACAGLAVAARRHPTRLVTISLLVAMGSLFLLDRYSLPRWERDRATRDFFARVERRMGGGGSLYSYDLNEDVLGRACLELSRPPLAQDDPADVEKALRRPEAFLLVETSALRKGPSSWAATLEPVELGMAGNRPVVLLRLRGTGRAVVLTAAGDLPRLTVTPSAPAVKALAYSASKEKSLLRARKSLP
jgi:4-amino-4-deoxy-L-arabinose transferase-like glycosyltransferase